MSYSNVECRRTTKITCVAPITFQILASHIKATYIGNLLVPFPSYIGIGRSFLDEALAISSSSYGAEPLSTHCRLL